jgi:hypothetical protein
MPSRPPPLLAPLWQLQRPNTESRVALECRCTPSMPLPRLGADTTGTTRYGLTRRAIKAFPL